MWEEDYATRMQSLPFWSSSLWENGPVFLAIRILRTTVSCQIITPATFACYRCWYPFLWNCISETLAWFRLVPASLCDWVRNFSHFCILRYNRHPDISTTDAMLETQGTIMT